MTPETIIREAHAQGVKLWADARALRYSGPQSAVSALLPEIRRYKLEILDLLSVKPGAPDIGDVRAAIMEHDGGLPKPEAERRAVVRACIRFKLHDLYGDPPQPGGGFVWGAPGQSAESLLAQLRELYDDRLAGTE